jgi:hypothetical protein
VYNAHRRQIGDTESELVLESEDYDELRRFQALTEED